MKKVIAFILGIFALVGSASAQDTAPSFPGGVAALNDFIAKNLVYPAAAIDNGAEGTVVVTFTVKADGSLDGFKIKRMVNPDLESEALRIAKKMPKWIPAQKDGSAVDSPASIPVKFRLQGS